MDGSPGRRRGFRLLGLILLASITGCNQQDTEALARMGGKVSTHTRSCADEMGAKLDMPWLRTHREPSLQEKVQQRLRWDNTLTDAAFEVIVTDKEVELKGTAKDARQRQRALELAQTTAGVDKVTDSMTVREVEEAAK
jgi:hypothetical protein